jgi:hypothetical protein
MRATEMALRGSLGGFGERRRRHSRISTGCRRSRMNTSRNGSGDDHFRVGDREVRVRPHTASFQPAQRTDLSANIPHQSAENAGRCR